MLWVYGHEMVYSASVPGLKGLMHEYMYQSTSTRSENHPTSVIYDHEYPANARHGFDGELMLGLKALNYIT